METDINLPFITADQRPQAPQPDDHPLQVRGPGARTCSTAFASPCERALGRQGHARRSTRWCWWAARPASPRSRDGKEIFGKEPNKSINPDEVVAIGAAIQGGVLQGGRQGRAAARRHPAVARVETLGGVMTKLIERTRPSPQARARSSPPPDNQTTVTIHVLQGEREFAKDNRTLGRFDLTDIPPAPRGMPQIEVELRSMRTASSTDEIDRMKREAEENADADKARRDLIDTKNRAEQVIYQTRKSLEEYGDKVSAEVRSNIESAVSSLETTLKGDDKAAIDAAMEHLNNAAMELGKIIYQQEAAKQQAAGGAPGAETAGAARGGGAAADDDVIDAEYEVKNDD
jgi:molecular chaperone DnaK